jgi:predicted O-linked N-acetylglucosamine transferase (SPINDLY family)
MTRMSIDQALLLSQQHINSNRMAEAGQILGMVLQADPGNHAAHYLVGVASFRAGAIEQAEAAFRQAVALNDQNVEYKNDHAGILHLLGRSAEGEAVARRAVRQAPQNVRALTNLGACLQSQASLEEAIDVLRRAVALQADHFEARVNLAISLQRAGRLEEAVEQHRNVLARWPQYGPACLNLSAALQELGRFDESVDACRQLIALEPQNINAYNNLGTALEKLRKFQEAETVYRQALRISPESPSIHYNLGNILRSLGRVEEAVEVYRRAIELKPDYYEAWNNLGNVLQVVGRLDEAEAACRRCVELRPNVTNAAQNLVNVIQLRGRLSEAEHEYRRMLAEEERAPIHSNLGATLQAEGRIEEGLTHFQRAIEMAPGDESFASNRLLCLQYRPGVTAAELAAAHAEWQQRHGVARRVHWRAHENSRDPSRPLRVGLLSADLWEHTVGLLVVPLLEHLDPRQIQLCIYYDNARHDHNLERIRRVATVWRDVCGMAEELLDRQIRDDQIDILFDLAGHTALNRLPLFARKPAPIQISWAGYVGTTGLEAMDYLLADRYEVPEGEESHYREAILRMPDGYICYGPPAQAPEVGPLPALGRGQVTFGSFNNPAKLNPEVLALWARVLRRVPDSRLMLKYRGLDNPPVQARFRELFARHEIGAERVELVAPSQHAGLLQTYGTEVDIGLDPFPYSGGITTCEALWMGVPVITCPGATFASRHSLTHLTNAGLGQFVARDFDHYVELAAEWARNLDQLAALRAGMRAQLLASPLCDAPRFARNFERLMREAWCRWVAGQ